MRHLAPEVEVGKFFFIMKKTSETKCNRLMKHYKYVVNGTNSNRSVVNL